MARGFPRTPGIYSQQQVAGWRAVTDAVHAKGGKIVLQLWHLGRQANASLTPDHALPLAPSAVPLSAASPCREMTHDEVLEAIEQFRAGAANALKAGFDGVEVHSANGYLVDQFLQSNTNTRTDAWGGSLEKRVRFLVEVTQAAASVFGADRVGVRLSPTGRAFGAMADANPVETFRAAVTALDGLGLAYLHIVEPRVSGNVTIADGEPLHEGAGELCAAALKKLFRGPVLSAGGHTAATGEAALASGSVDAVVYGRHYVSTPDLVERLAKGEPFNAYDRDTFYTNDFEGPGSGYLDPKYATLDGTWH